MLTEDRRKRILEFANQNGAVRVNELAKLLHVSTVTIRQDLGRLAREGYVIRKQGGAIIHPRTDLSVKFDLRASINLEAKRRIGQAAASLVKPGETIIIDAGTTALEMAKRIAENSALTIVTNSLNVATQAGAVPGVNVLLLGGSLSPETVSTIGPITEQELGEIVVSKLFLGVHAVDPATGLMDVSMEVARVKRAMIKAAQKVILLADSSKWQQKAFIKIALLTVVQVMITDANMPEAARQAIKELGIELIVV